jgi:hypothetical protein
MFQSVRQNSQVYVLHRTDKPYIEVGQVISQPITKPKYTIPTTFGQPQELITDISVKIGDKTVNYAGLPAQQDIADTFSNGESIVVADSREAMNSEILSSKQKSIDIINSKSYHEGLVQQYDKILVDLNPEYAEKQNQKEEINTLKGKMDEMSRNVSELMKTNALLLERLSKTGM